MTIGLLAPALAITLCVAVGLMGVSCKNWALVSGPTQDDGWTVIEYPDGQEVTVELKPTASMANAKSTARVMRSGNETTINLDVSGVTTNEKSHEVYVVDSLGNATLLGTLAITDGSGNLTAKTALSKFMIVVSPEADLTAISSETTVSLRSTVPSGYIVFPREISIEIERAEANASPAQMEPADTESTEYDVPLLGIGSLRQGSNTMMRANFSNGFEGTRAKVVITPKQRGLTKIKMRFSNLKEAPGGMQYVLWEVTPDNSYSLLGHLTQIGKKNEARIDTETPKSDFGLFITSESVEANPSSPAGNIVVTIVR